MILYGLLLYYLLLLCCFVDLASSQDIPLINPFTGAVIKQTEEDRPRQLVVIVTGASSGIGKDTVLEFAKNKKFKVYATMRDIHKWTPDSDSYGKGTIAVNHADHPTSTYDPHLSTEDSEKKERDRERRKQDRLSQKDTLHVEVESGYNNVVLLNMDVTDDKSVQRAVDYILSKEDNHIDILVNNAGYGIAGCLENVYIQEAKKLFEVNVWGAVRVMQAVLPTMRFHKNGHVINISSTSGIRGIPCMEYYSGSKFALEGIADSLRYSLSVYNIAVTQINAGPVRTKFTDTFGDVGKGGKGTRPVLHSQDNYLQDLTDKMIASLNRRMESPEAQDSDAAARVIVNIAILKLAETHVYDVPFNMGTNRDSQGVIEAVRKNPTGWTGMYANLLKSIPPLPEDAGRSEL